jgi:hypothetical protein
LPRDEFLRARDAMSKELKAAGDGDAAEEIKKLRKPTVAAWALNRLARTRSADLDRLIEAGEDLSKLQRKAVSGVSREDLRSASTARRRSIDALVAAAEEELREVGQPVTRQTLDRVAQTLEAIAVDESARELVRRGVLEKELSPEAGFGDLSGLSLVAPPREKEKAPARGARESRPADAAARRARKRELERETRLRERADRLAQEADQAEAEARSLRDEAAKAERVAMKARNAAERAEARAAQARDRAEAARREVPG